MQTIATLLLSCLRKAKSESLDIEMFNILLYHLQQTKLIYLSLFCCVSAVHFDILYMEKTLSLDETLLRLRLRSDITVAPYSNICMADIFQNVFT